MSGAKLDKAALREQFIERMQANFANRFDGLEIETTWSLFDTRYMSTRKDGQPFHMEHIQFLNGFEAGWLDAFFVAEQV